MGSCMGKFKIGAKGDAMADALNFTADLSISEEEAADLMRQAEDLILLELKHSMPSAPTHRLGRLAAAALRHSVAPAERPVAPAERPVAPASPASSGSRREAERAICDLSGANMQTSAKADQRGQSKTNREYFELAAKCREDFGDRCIAFVQIGSFFETRGEFAEMMVEHAMVRSFVCGGQRVAGVQVAGHARVVRMLLSKGFIVALHEQFEATPGRPSLGLVRRRTRVYTPSNPPAQESDADDEYAAGGSGASAGAAAGSSECAGEPWAADDDSRVLLSAFCTPEGVGIATMDAATGRTELFDVPLLPRGARNGGGSGIGSGSGSGAAREARARLRLENVGKGRGATCYYPGPDRESAEATAAARSAHIIASHRPVEALVASVSVASAGVCSRLPERVYESAKASGAFVTRREVSRDSEALSEAHQDEVLRSVFGAAAARSMLGVDDSLGLSGSRACKAALCEIVRYVAAASPQGVKGLLPPASGVAPSVQEGGFGGARCGFGGASGVMTVEGSAMRQLDAGLLAEMGVRPMTAPGRREMLARLASPLTDPDGIEARLDEVERCATPAAAVSDVTVGDLVRAALKGSPDPLRSLRRLATGAAGPGEWERLVKGCDAARTASAAFCGDGSVDPVAQAHAAVTLAVCEEVDIGRASSAGAAAPSSREYYSSFFARGAAPEIDDLSDAVRSLEEALDTFVGSLNDAGGSIGGDKFVTECVRDEGASYLVTTATRLNKIKAGAGFVGRRADGVAAVGLPEIEAGSVTGCSGSGSGSGSSGGQAGPAGFSVTGRTVDVPLKELRHSGARAASHFSAGEAGALPTPPANAVLHRRIGDVGAALRHSRTALRAAVLERHRKLARRVSLDLSAALVVLSDRAASLDVSSALAATALRDGLVRPRVLRDGPSSIGATGLRHPIVVAQDRAETVVGNDVELSMSTPGRQALVLFGLNASGKSTLLKACGLAAMCAQAGWFVAADSLSVRPFDSLHASITSADDISSGRSLFQSECLEMRRVLELAGPGSLVLADEPCSSTEAVSAVCALAAFVETLVGSGAKAVVSSHFHDLPMLPRIRALSSSAVRIAHLHTSVGEGDGCAITFDRRLREGPGSSEYGLLIMRAMAMPQEFLRFAEANRRALGEAAANPLGFKGAAAAAADASHASTAYADGAAAAADAGAGVGAGADAATSAPARKSRYNARVRLATCEECGEGAATETHHMVPRAQLRAAGASARSGNRRGNLAALCSACHDRLHSSDDVDMKKGGAAPRRRVLTSAGLRLMDPRLLEL